MTSSAHRTTDLATFLGRLIWICILPLLLLGAYFTVDRILSEKRNQDEFAGHLLRNRALEIDNYLAARLAALQVLAKSPLADHPDRYPELYRVAQAFQREFDGHVVLAGLDARMLFNTRSPYGTPLPTLPPAPSPTAVEQALASGRAAVGNRFIGPITKSPLIAIAAPILRDGAPRALLIVTFETAIFQKYLDAIALPGNWRITLLDAKGQVIAGRGGAPSPAESSDAVERLTIKSTRSPWSVVLEIPRQDNLAHLLSIGWPTGAGLLLAILSGVAGGRIASRRLTREMAALAANPASHHAPLQITEIAGLGAQLDAAAGAHEADEAALRRSEAHFRALFFLAPLPLAIASANGSLLEFNRQFTEVLGYTPADLPDLDAWWRQAYPDAARRAQASAAWAAALAETSNDGSTIGPGEYAITCRDGTVRLFEISGIRIGDDILAAFVDQTVHRRDEDEIRRLNASLEARVAQRTQALTLANNELDSFAYAVSHDLRAPLRAMSGFAQALAEDCADQLHGDGPLYLAHIQQASQRMGALIDALLALSRSTRGELQRRPVNLSALAGRLLAEHQAAEPERVVKIDIADDLTAHADPAMLEAVLRNLLDNAWKYTARTPLAHIRVYQETIGGCRQFCVADNGAGFDMAHGRQLFKPFQRLHRQDEFPGLGIGLATVQRIIHRHGGTIDAEGRVGAGAVFRFTLPAEPAPMDALPVG